MSQPGETAPTRKRRRFETHPPAGPDMSAAIAKAMEIVKAKLPGAGVAATPSEFSSELEINDCQNRAVLIRSSTHKEVFQRTGAGVSTKGRYFPPGEPAREGERALYLLVTARSQAAVDAGLSMLREMMLPASEVIDCISINIPKDSAFSVVDRVSGPAGCFLKHIEQQTGCSVLLSGQGSSQEPLHLKISSTNSSSVAQAKELVGSLLARVYSDYTQWQQSAATQPSQFWANSNVDGAVGVSEKQSPRMAECVPEDEVPAELKVLYTGIAPPARPVIRQTSKMLEQKKRIGGA